jgi:hypothetical protein
VSLFLPTATLFLSIAVVVIAALQWRIAANKLRLDLFDRRYKVYEATLAFLRASVRDTARIDQLLIEFNYETSNAEFLFEADVVNYLHQIRERARDDDILWLSDPQRVTEITNIFARYLRFGNVRSRLVPFVNFF